MKNMSVKNDKNICDLFFIDGKFKAVKLREYFLTQYDVVYCPEIGFLMWNDQYWKIVNENYIGHLLDQILEYETSSRRISETINIIKKFTHIDVENINKNRYKLVLKNGTVDLSIWNDIKFHENKFFKNDYCTIQLNVSYNEDAMKNCYNWKRYLETTFDNDLEIIKLIQEMLAYCLQPQCNLEKAFILYGEGGNGKSKLLNIIDYIWTDSNVSDIPMNDLDKAFSRSSLYGKLINKSSEMESKVADTGYFKKLVSGEFVDAQFKFKDVFKFKNMAKLIFSMNNLPQIKDKSDGFYRRISIIPFLHKFQDDEKDINLDEKLQSEADGIFMFALKGLERLQKQKRFTHSTKAESLICDFRKNNNPIEQYFEDCIDLDDESKIVCKDLYIHYQKYCTKNGIRDVLNNANFGKEMNRKYGNDIKKRITIKGVKENCYVGMKTM